MPQSMNQIIQKVWNLFKKKSIQFWYLSKRFFSSAPTASAADVQKIRDAIKNASSLQEVERLTRILQSGNIPEEFLSENGHDNGNGTNLQIAK